MIQKSYTHFPDMLIYKNRDVRNELLLKLEEFEPSTEYTENNYGGWGELCLHSDNYEILYNIIMNYGNDLLYIRNLLLHIINELKKKSSRIYNLRLKILESRLRHQSGRKYYHDYFCMRDLPKFGCTDIVDLTYNKHGVPDYWATSPYRDRWEIKIITGNRLVFTQSQLNKFDKNVNILIYKIVEHDSYRIWLNHVGAEFQNHIKFGDIYDILLEKGGFSIKSYFSHKFGNRLLDNERISYQIVVGDSSESAKSIIKNRYIREENAKNAFKEFFH